MLLQRSLTLTTTTLSFHTFIVISQHISRSYTIPLISSTCIFYSLALILKLMIQKKKPAEPIFISSALSFFVALIDFVIVYTASHMLITNNIGLLYFTIITALAIALLIFRNSFSYVTLFIAPIIVFIIIAAMKIEIIENTQCHLEDYDIEVMYLGSKEQFALLLMFAFIVRSFISQLYKNSNRYKPYFLIAIALAYSVLFHDEFTQELSAIKMKIGYAVVSFLCLMYFSAFYVENKINFICIGFAGLLVYLVSVFSWFNLFFLKTRFERLIDSAYFWLLPIYLITFIIVMNWDCALGRTFTSNHNHQGTNQQGNATQFPNTRNNANNQTNNGQGDNSNAQGGNSNAQGGNNNGQGGNNNGQGGNNNGQGGNNEPEFIV